MESRSDGLIDEHYLRAITELGDNRRIVTSCDIHSQSGIKLVAAGIHVTSELYDRLVRHKLLPPLDKALAIENMLDAGSVAADMVELVERNDRLKKAAHAINQGYSYRQIIAGIRLPQPLAFKLTVAKEKFERIYQHSLLLTVISLYLARCDGRMPHEEEHIAMAALFHDLGMMHMDPKLLDPLHVMSADERRHLYAHPLTAYLLLCEFPELPKAVANAVLEHHERMDGSGYPRGLHGEKISRGGQILAIAEFVAKTFEPDPSSVTWRKLDVMLKLNSRKYGQGLIGHLGIFRESDPPLPAEPGNLDLLAERARLIAKLFDDFDRYADLQHRTPVLDFTETRLTELRLSLVEAGFDPRDPGSLIQMIGDDPEGIADYAPLLEEAIWQFQSLVLEISRQWPEITGKSENGTKRPEWAWLSGMILVLYAAVACSAS